MHDSRVRRPGLSDAGLDRGAQELFAPCVIIDISSRVPKLPSLSSSSTTNANDENHDDGENNITTNPSRFDVTVTVDDLLAWEDNNQQDIPEGALVCMKSG